MNLRRISALLPLLCLGACQKGTDANSISNRFVDAYYLQFNFEQALGFTAGAATRRIEAEQKLVGAARANGALSRARAKVYYESPEHRTVREDLSHHTYVLESHVGASRLTTRVLVMTARREEHWKVISFRELGRPSSKGNPQGIAGEKDPDDVQIKSRSSTTSTAAEVNP
jgi:hypothetical protein